MHHNNNVGLSIAIQFGGARPTDLNFGGAIAPPCPPCSASPERVGGKHCKRMASLYKHMGKLQRALTLILRCESKFRFQETSSYYPFCMLISIICRECFPRVSNISLLYIKFFFFYLVCNLSIIFLMPPQ